MEESYIYSCFFINWWVCAAFKNIILLLTFQGHVVFDAQGSRMAWTLIEQLQGIEFPSKLHIPPVLMTNML